MFEEPGPECECHRQTTHDERGGLLEGASDCLLARERSVDQCPVCLNGVGTRDCQDYCAYAEGQAYCNEGNRCGFQPPHGAARQTTQGPVVTAAD